MRKKKITTISVDIDTSEKIETLSKLWGINKIDVVKKITIDALQLLQLEKRKQEENIEKELLQNQKHGEYLKIIFENQKVIDDKITMNLALTKELEQKIDLKKAKRSLF